MPFSSIFGGKKSDKATRSSTNTATADTAHKARGSNINTEKSISKVVFHGSMDSISTIGSTMSTAVDDTEWEHIGAEVPAYNQALAIIPRLSMADKVRLSLDAFYQASREMEEVSTMDLEGLQFLIAAQLEAVKKQVKERKAVEAEQTLAAVAGVEAETK